MGETQMNIFITATDTDVGKTYVSKGIVKELIKRGKKTGYFKPLQSGIVPNILSDADNVLSGLKNVPADANAASQTANFADNLTVKNSYITKTPCTPSVSAEIDGIEISINKILEDYKELEKTCDTVVVEGSGGLFVPAGEDFMMSDIIKILNLSAIIIARPDLGTINHTLLTIQALRHLEIKILGVIISNYPKNTTDPAIITAPDLIEKFGDIKVLDIIQQDGEDFSKIVDILIS